MPEEAGRRRTMPDRTKEIRGLVGMEAVGGPNGPCLALSLKAGFKGH